jgi:predicted dehydrogenase
MHPLQHKVNHQQERGAVRSPFRVAIAGLGFGAEVHVPGFRSLADVEVVAIAGVSAEKAQRVAHAMGIPAGVGGYENLLNFKLDAVSIALPPKQNAAAAEFFLSQGIPVLCEKPMAGDVASARRLVQLSRQITHAIDFQFAELPVFYAARSAIQSGRIGHVRHIQTTWLVESYANRYQTQTWKRDPLGAGGVLSLFASHTLYLVGWLVSSISTVSARLSAKGEMWRDESNISPDTCQCWAELEDGATFSLMVSNAAPELYTHRWEIIGDSGSIVLENKSKDYMSGFALTIFDRHGSHRIDSGLVNHHEDGRIYAFAALASRFTNSVKAKVQTHPSFIDGYRVQCEINAIFDSNSRQHIVRLSKKKEGQ